MRSPEELRDPQQRAISGLYEHDNLLLVMGMGGGKTASALTAFHELRRDRVFDRLLVAVPAGVLLHRVWEQEAPRWSHLQDLTVQPLIGSPRTRTQLMAEHADVYIVSHNNLVKTLREWPHDKTRTVLCWDEFSRLKNPKSAAAKGILEHGKDLGAIWGLTGTPRPNGYLDVYRPYEVLSRGRIWGGLDFWTWRARNFMPLDPKWFGCKIHDFRRREIDELIAPYTLVIDNSAVDAALPAYNEGPEFDILTDLSAEARAAYRKMARSSLTSVDGKVVLAKSAAAAQSKLEQIVQGFLYDEEGNSIGWSAPTKAARLAEVLDELDSGDPTLVCYWFREDLTALRKVLGKNLPVVGGSTPDKTKAAHIEAWNRGELPVLAVHPQSVGHGTELQRGGRRMIWYCPVWSAELYAQTVKRIARPGQTRPVFIHRMVANGTVDMLKLARCEGKIEDEQDFVDMLSEWAK